MGHSCSHPVHIESPLPNREHRYRCQQVTTVREPFSSQFPFLQRVRSMNSVSFAMLRAEKAEIWQTPETLCHEDFLVRFGVSCRCQESRRRTSNGFCMLLPCLTLGQCLAGVAHQLMGHSCSYPVHINRQYPTDRHRCRCQAVTTVREAFSSQFPFSQRVRSMNSVSFAMLRAEKAGVFQTPQTLCWEEGFVSDAAVLRRPEILSLLGITLPVPVPGKNE